MRGTTALGWIVYGFMLGRTEAGGWGFIIAPFCASPSTGGAHATSGMTLSGYVLR